MTEVKPHWMAQVFWRVAALFGGKPSIRVARLGPDRIWIEYLVGTKRWWWTSLTLHNALSIRDGIDEAVRRSEVEIREGKTNAL